MTKILVCGSLGFAMSNFIRYLLYRTKDFEIISVDKISDVKDAKRRYINRMNKFYIGDITDSEFIAKLVMCEKPDIIINGINTEDPSIVVSSYNLSRLSIPVIQLVPCIWEHDKNGWWNAAAMTIENAGGKILELPNCFGRWQKPNDGAARIMKQMLQYEKAGAEVSFADKLVPWVYYEDFCSMLWFMIENIENIPNHIRCPISGLASEFQIAEITKDIFGLKTKLKKGSSSCSELCCGYYGDKVKDWEPEGTEILKALKDTVEWYKRNQWALM